METTQEWRKEFWKQTRPDMFPAWENADWLPCPFQTTDDNAEVDLETLLEVLERVAFDKTGEGFQLDNYQLGIYTVNTPAETLSESTDRRTAVIAAICKLVGLEMPED